MASKLTDYHLRGLVDNAGSPSTTIATEAVEHWSDGSLRWTRPNGNVVVLRGKPAAYALKDLLGKHSVTLGIDDPGTS